MKTSLRVIAALIITTMGLSSCQQPAVTSTSQTPDIVVSDQTISHSNEIEIKSAYLDKPGYIVLHKEASGNLDDIVGTSPLLAAGLHTNIKIKVTDPRIGKNVQALIYNENNGNSTFDKLFDPAVSVGGSILMRGFDLLPPTIVNTTNNTNIVSFLTNIPNLVVRDQPMSNQVVVPSVNLDKPGYIVIQNDVNGAPGQVIGVSPLLAAGTRNDVVVGLDQTKAESISHISLFYETSNNTGFDISLDQPVTINNRAITLPIIFSSTVNSPVSFFPNLVVSNQNISNNQVKINSLFIDKPGYVVIQKDINGTPGEVLGHSALLGPGGHTDLNININSNTVGTLGNMVHATVHYEDNNNFTYDFPLADQPVLVADKPIGLTITNINE